MVDKLSKDWIARNGQKLKEAYSFAVINKFNIKSERDVLKILKLIDPKNANEEYAKIFSKMLQLFSKTVQKKLNLVGKTRKPKIVN